MIFVTVNHFRSSKYEIRAFPVVEGIDGIDVDKATLSNQSQAKEEKLTEKKNWKLNYCN
jgi:hypothetical protein